MPSHALSRAQPEGNLTGQYMPRSGHRLVDLLDFAEFQVRLKIGSTEGKHQGASAEVSLNLEVFDGDGSDTLE